MYTLRGTLFKGDSEEEEEDKKSGLAFDQEDNQGNKQVEVMVKGQEEEQEAITKKLEKKVDKARKVDKKKVKDNRADLFDLQHQDKKPKDLMEDKKQEEEEEEEDKADPSLGYREKLHFDLSRRKCRD